MCPLRGVGVCPAPSNLCTHLSEGSEPGGGKGIEGKEKEEEKEKKMGEEVGTVEKKEENGRGKDKTK